ncbi:hypothetical protein PanWU01x14_150230 [Parasponia andersonii]|uniref:Uncharacterized protein n=1 Tax=Parasponia andersonii TaxID=3476 RepID=A0A2P5CIS2_PARAD|nr:hypothetical protein PanWU01x14_150230 [Parasponia andersonii]
MIVDSASIVCRLLSWGGQIWSSNTYHANCHAREPPLPGHEVTLPSNLDEHSEVHLRHQQPPAKVARTSLVKSSKYWLISRVKFSRQSTSLSMAALRICTPCSSLPMWQPLVPAVPSS